MKRIDYTHGIRSLPSVHGGRIVYIDNVEWCIITDEAYQQKLVPAFDELWRRRERVATGQADTVLD